MLERVLIAGAGGQGVLLAGRILATVAIRHAPHVTYFPDYGAEVRGGTSKCQVVLSSDEIASPVCDCFESVLVMNQASVERYRDHVAGAELAVLNSSLCDEPNPAAETLVTVPATEMAVEMGDPRVANVIMLGAYVAKGRFPGSDAIPDGIQTLLAGKAKRLIDLNLSAFRVGLQL